MRTLLLFSLSLSLLIGCTNSGVTPQPSPAPAMANLSATIAPVVTPTQPPPTQPPPSRSGATATVTNAPADVPYPAGCTPAEVETFFGRFLAAFNHGDLAALRAFFPTVEAGRSITDHTGERFVWYSVGDTHPDGSGRHFVAYDLATLWAYFAERHGQHETLRLASVKVSASQQDPINVNMSLSLHRAADDVPSGAGTPPGQASGKGVLNCRDQTLRVLGFGQGPGPGAAATPTR